MIMPVIIIIIIIIMKEWEQEVGKVPMQTPMSYYKGGLEA